MRLLKLGIYHTTYLQNFYRSRPALKQQSYDVQHRALIKDGFGSADFWTSAFNKLDYETADLVANAEFLQKRWARENDCRFDERRWLFEIAAAQIKKFRPDVLLIADYSTFTADFLRNVRRECPSVRLILGWCGAPYSDLSVFREWDVALSCVPEMVADFRAAGLRGFHVNHAFAPRILNELDTKSPPSIDFAFIGSVLKQNKFHLERERLLLHLVKFTNLQIWSELKRPTFGERGNAQLRRGIYGLVTRAPQKLTDKLPLARRIAAWKMPSASENGIDELIARRTHPPVFGLEMFRQLRRSRVVFNNHIDISPVSASNMRLFETTGVGACLLTDRKKNLPELFEPDKEVLTYASAEECVEKVRYLLENEAARRAMAEAGQRRTLREHTFENRAARIDEIIRQSLTSTT
jgi:spore maturation protein CgeB